MPYVFPLTTFVFQIPGKKSSRRISFDGATKESSGASRVERDELRHPGVAEHCDVGRGLADVGGEELLVSRRPGNLLDLDVDVGVLFLEYRNELGEHFAFSAHRPDAERGLVTGRCR